MRRVTPGDGKAGASPSGRAARAARRRLPGLLLGSVALASVILPGGCASPPPPEAAVRGQAAVARAPAIPCTTTSLVLATVSRCGSGGLKFGVAAE